MNNKWYDRSTLLLQMAALGLGLWNVLNSHGWMRVTMSVLLCFIAFGVILATRARQRWRDAKWQAMAMSNDPLGTGAAWEFVESLSLREFRTLINWMAEHTPEDIDHTSPEVVLRMAVVLSNPPEEL